MENSTARPPLRPLPSPSSILSSRSSFKSPRPLSLPLIKDSKALPRNFPTDLRRRSVYDRLTSTSHTQEIGSDKITTTRPSSCLRSSIERPTTAKSSSSQASPSTTNFSPLLPSIAPPIWNPLTQQQYSAYSHHPHGFSASTYPSLHCHSHQIPPVYPHPLYPFPLPLISRPPTEQEWLARFQGVTPSLVGGGGLQAHPVSTTSSYRPLPPLPVRPPEPQSRSRLAPTLAHSKSQRLPRPIKAVKEGNEVNSKPSIPRSTPVPNPRPISRAPPPSLSTVRSTRHIPPSPPRATSNSREDGLRRSTRHDQTKPIAPTPHLPLERSLKRKGVHEQGGGEVGGKAPIVVSPTLFEDELCVVLSVVVDGSLIARRTDIDWINCTKLLNMSGMTRGKRDMILKNEDERDVYRKGTVALKGVWLPLKAALRLAKEHDLVDQLYPLFEPNLVDWLFTPTNRERTAQLVQACQGRAILQDDYTFGVPRTNVLSGGSKRKRDDEGEQEKRQRQQRLIGFLESLEVGLGLNTSATSSTLPPPHLPESRSINKVQEVEEEEENGRSTIPQPAPLPTTRITPSALAHVRTGLAPLPSKPLARPSQLFEVPVDLCPRPVPCPRQTPNGPVLHRLSTSATNGEVAWFDNDTPPASTKTPIDSSNFFGFRTNLATARRGLTPTTTTSAPQFSSDIPDDHSLPTTTRSMTPVNSQIASTSSSTVPSTNASTPFPFSRDSSAISSIPSSTVTSPGPSVVEAAAIALEKDYPSSLPSHRSEEGEAVAKRFKAIHAHNEEEEGEEREGGSPGRGRKKLLRKRKDQVREDPQDNEEAS